MYQKFIKTCIQEEKIPSFTATMRKGKNHSSQPKSKFGTKPGLVEYNMTFVDENNVAFEYILNLQTGKFQEVGTKEMYHSNYQIKGIRCKRVKSTLFFLFAIIAIIRLFIIFTIFVLVFIIILIVILIF